MWRNQQILRLAFAFILSSFFASGAQAIEWAPRHDVGVAAVDTRTGKVLWEAWRSDEVPTRASKEEKAAVEYLLAMAKDAGKAVPHVALLPDVKVKDLVVKNLSLPGPNVPGPVTSIGKSLIYYRDAHGIIAFDRETRKEVWRLPTTRYPYPSTVLEAGKNQALIQIGSDVPATIRAVLIADSKLGLKKLEPHTFKQRAAAAVLLHQYGDGYHRPEVRKLIDQIRKEKTEPANLTKDLEALLTGWPAYRNRQRLVDGCVAALLNAEESNPFRGFTWSPTPRTLLWSLLQELIYGESRDAYSHQGDRCVYDGWQERPISLSDGAKKILGDHCRDVITEGPEAEKPFAASVLLSNAVGWPTLTNAERKKLFLSSHPSVWRWTAMALAKNGHRKELIEWSSERPDTDHLDVVWVLRHNKPKEWPEAELKFWLAVARRNPGSIAYVLRLLDGPTPPELRALIRTYLQHEIEKPTVKSGGAQAAYDLQAALFVLDDWKDADDIKLLLSYLGHPVHSFASRGDGKNEKRIRVYALRSHVRAMLEKRGVKVPAGVIYEEEVGPEKPAAPREGKVRSQPVKIEILKTENDVWTMSNDKVVGLQLSGDVDPASKTQPIVLKATIRNFSSRLIAVPKPLGGPFIGMPQGLDVRGPKGVVKYTGPAVNPRHWAGSDFVALIPGQKHEIHFKLDPNLFSGGDTPGKYTIKFDYETKAYQDIAKDLGIATYWSGRLPCVTFVYDHPKDAKRELPLPNEVLNAGLNPKDPRILALVAYLDKNGMKLVHSGSSGDWHITKPAPPDGAFVVSIRTFPEDASEIQMRMVTGGGRRLPDDPIGFNLAYKLNAPARIAMSYVGGKGTTKATKEDFAAVETKLAHLFNEYRPAAPKDAKRELPLPNEVLSAGLNPKDPRILALVAYLDKNGMKLVHSGFSGYWHITKPAAPDGTLQVGIRTFPEDASEKQMRMVIGGPRLPDDPIGFNLSYKLNAPARIAMSYVSGAGTTKTTKEDIAAVETKLAHLFKEYRPAAPKDAVDEIRLLPPEKSGWMIRFRPNGSVGAQWSRCDYPGGDTAKLPKGSVDFDSLLKAAYRLKSEKRLERLSTISVSLRDETNTAFSLHDDTLFRYLIASFDKKWQSEVGGTRFDELRRKYPIYETR